MKMPAVTMDLTTGVLIRMIMIIVACALGSCNEERYPGPLTPEEALGRFDLRDGFEIRLFASEPHVQDPVEMVFDEQGNIFVVEMPDYPFKPEPGEGRGRIKVIQDTNDDGVIDNAVVFADLIPEATSVLPWREGLLVTAAPYILYLKDTNADLRADTREILFSGFFENNSEAQITSLRLGIDNWIYAANNGQAGEVTFHRSPASPPLSMRAGDFRFRLDREEFEKESGAAQFGHTLDDAGNRFITHNTLHIRQVVMPWRYLHRHDHLPAYPSVHQISDHELEMFQATPAPYWRAERTRRRQEMYEAQNLDRTEYADDHFTGSSGGTIYDGDAFPPEYYGNVFTGDVAGNLVHRDVLVPADSQALFIARRAGDEERREFLTSTDPWFRPVNFTVGPDGSLFVIDMYRQHIETPLSIPEDLKQDMNFYNGMDRGRIYRIAPDTQRVGKRARPALRSETTPALVRRLADPHRWWRQQAQRLLIERRDPSSVPMVSDLWDTHKDHRVRLHALYVLEGLHALDEKILREAMHSADPELRKHGILLAERFPALRPEILAGVGDSVATVAFQATLSAGQFAGSDVARALAEVLAQRGWDPWFRTAVLSSEEGISRGVLQRLVNHRAFAETGESWRAAVLQDWAFAAGSSADAEKIDALLALIAAPEAGEDPVVQLACVNGLKNGLLKSAATEVAMKEKLKAIGTEKPGQIRAAIAALNEIRRNL